MHVIAAPTTLALSVEMLQNWERLELYIRDSSICMLEWLCAMFDEY